ncbi:MAG: YicC/YloC family endoribonuclease [Verrucomicrobiota bacterium]|nr:YicC/YloC family endoribonuclease [Verrucomicrobiota bacterium]
MISLTGFGRAEMRESGITIIVEIKSYNRKGLEVSCSLPDQLNFFDISLQKLIKEKIFRGKVYLTGKVHLDDDKIALKYRVNQSVMERYILELKKVASKTKIKNEISLGDLVGLPDVIQEKSSFDNEEISELMEKTTVKALVELCDMRETEGEELKKDLGKRILKLEDCLSFIDSESEIVPLRYKEKLIKRINALNQNIDENNEILQREIAIFADRCDITEEITRIKSHIKQIKNSMHLKEPIGRKIDFIIQELSREINTICSKGSDSEISNSAVEFKTELEKIREQIQNVE